MAKYLKPDCEKGYIEDPADIQAIQFDNLRHTIYDCMLGDFDENGFYVVQPDIVQELIEMPKSLVDTVDNIEICHSLIKFDKQISFMVTYEGECVTLSLVEKLNYEANNTMTGGTWSNVNEYILDKLITSGEVNKQVIYQRWNINPFSGAVIDIFNCDESVLAKYFGIVSRFKYLMEANSVLLEKEEELEEIEAEYTLDIMEILKRYPVLKEAVEKELKKTLSEKKGFVRLDKPKFAKTVNEILEKAIEKNVAVLPVDKKEEFFAEKRNATVRSNIKKRETLEVEDKKVKRVQEVEDKKVQDTYKKVVTLNNKDEVKNPTTKDDAKTPVVKKIKTENVDSKSVQEVGQKLATTTKKENVKAKEKATDVMAETSSSKVAKMVEKLQKDGVDTKNLVSKVVQEQAANKKKSPPVVVATAPKAEPTKLVKEAAAKTEAKKQEAKPTAKKTDKKPEKKTDKKGKKEEKKEKGIDYSTYPTLKKADKKQTGKSTNNTTANNNQNHEEHMTTAMMGVVAGGDGNNVTREKPKTERYNPDKRVTAKPEAVKPNADKQVKVSFGEDVRETREGFDKDDVEYEATTGRGGDRTKPDKATGVRADARRVGGSFEFFEENAEEVGKTNKDRSVGDTVVQIKLGRKIKRDSSKSLGQDDDLEEDLSIPTD